jgi:uncharacterized protein with GYD domain
MIFITLYKFRRKPTKADIEKANKVFEQASKEGVKTIGVWWTLGRYDAVRIFEAKEVKDAMKVNLELEAASTETLVAVPREEALKLL